MMLMRAYDANKTDGTFYAESHRGFMSVEIRQRGQVAEMALDEEAVRDLARLCEIHLAKQGTLGARQ